MKVLMGILTSLCIVSLCLNLFLIFKTNKLSSKIFSLAVDIELLNQIENQYNKTHSYIYTDNSNEYRKLATDINFIKKDIEDIKRNVFLNELEITSLK